MIVLIVVDRSLVRRRLRPVFRAAQRALQTMTAVLKRFADS